MIVRFQSYAAEELLHSARWYFAQSQIASENFLHEIDRCVLRISESPETFPKYFYGTRRVLMKTFPYSIVFRIKPETIEIIALAHAKRRPGYWKRRSTKTYNANDKSLLA